MIDTSGDYGTQPGVGEGIRQSGVRREDIFVVTKVEETDDAYEATRRNLDQLGMDHVDLMLIHRPPKSGAGIDLWRGLIRARDEDLVTDIGVSNYSEALIEELVGATGEVPVVNQLEWSPFGHSANMYRYRRLTAASFSRPTAPSPAPRVWTTLSCLRSPGSMARRTLRSWSAGTFRTALFQSRRRAVGATWKRISTSSTSNSMTTISPSLNQADQHYSALGSLPY